VLPFQNRGPSPDDYLAEELTDDLIDSLSSTGQLRVRPRGAVLRFADTSGDPADIGRELGVEAVIEGSVRRQGERVRINARLIQVSDGFQVWAKRFDRLASEVLEINDAVMRAVAAALSVQVRSVTRVLPANNEAIDLFLRGRHELRKLWPENLARAIDLFEQAERLAPDTPLVLAAKATALVRRSTFTGTGLDEGRSAAERAVALAPNLAEARLALGNVLIQQGDSAEGVREITSAIEAQPAFADAHAILGRILGETELLDEGVRHLELAVSFDADHPVATAALARAHSFRGDFAAAFTTLDQHRQRAGRGFHEGAFARLVLWERNRARAEAMLAELAPGGEGPPIARLLLAAACGDLSMLRAAEAKAQRDGKRPSYLAQIGAECRAVTGDHEGALAAIEQYAEGGYGDVAWLDRCPLFGELRGSPRFSAAREQVAARAAAVTRAYLASQQASDAPPVTQPSGTLLASKTQRT
jgi:TolB-like protein/tetratricopeptide (TPR) repeat protein